MTRHLRVTLLGCGSSGGVPRVGGDWGACDPREPKNRRWRCSLLVEYREGRAEEYTRALIDTSPDLREQFISYNIKDIDAVLYTHEHGDQTNGIDDLRAMAYRKRERIPAYMSKETKAELTERFRYCFYKPKGRVHPPILKLKPVIKPGQTVKIEGAGGDLDIQVFDVGHGNISSLGFSFCKQIAYTPDAHTLTDLALKALDNIDVWIVDALRYQDHPTHANADKTLQWHARTRAKKLILTNMHIDMDYQTLSNELPGNQHVGYDGLVIERTF